MWFAALIVSGADSASNFSSRMSHSSEAVTDSLVLLKTTTKGLLWLDSVASDAHGAHCSAVG